MGVNALQTQQRNDMIHIFRIAVVLLILLLNAWMIGGCMECYDRGMIPVRSTLGYVCVEEK